MPMTERRLLLPVNLLEGVISSVPGGTHLRIETKLLRPGRPVRLVSPSFMAADFTVGAFGVRRGSGDVEVVAPWDAGRTVSLSIFSELFKELDFDVGMPVLRAGDAVVFELANMNYGCRNFSVAWLIDPIEGGQRV